MTNTYENAVENMVESFINNQAGETWTGDIDTEREYAEWLIRNELDESDVCYDKYDEDAEDKKEKANSLYEKYCEGYKLAEFKAQS